jgi:hypothetical protein
MLAWDMAQAVELVSTKLETLCSNPGIAKKKKEKLIKTELTMYYINLFGIVTMYSPYTMHISS